MSATTLRDEHDFTIRGAQPTRVDAFVDAAFAFAVTLLIVAFGHVPASVGELVQALRGVPAFLASFFVMMRFWQTHRLWSRHYGIEDAYAVRLSLALVFLVLVYVYPLRMIAEFTFAEISAGALAETRVMLDSIDDLRTLYVVFGVGYAATAAIFLLLHRHALASADALALNAAERIRTATLCVRWRNVIAIALASVVLALIVPMGHDARLGGEIAPGAIYIFVLVSARVLNARQKRELAALGRRA
jgi:uncharacterized membrane protein